MSKKIIRSKALDTTHSNTPLAVNSKEELFSATDDIESEQEKIKLHRIAKTGSYINILNKPFLDTSSESTLDLAFEYIIGKIKLHKIAKTGDYNDLINKAILKYSSTSLSPVNEVLAGNINLHKVAKTGDYNDLKNKYNVENDENWQKLYKAAHIASKVASKYYELTVPASILGFEEDIVFIGNCIADSEYSFDGSVQDALSRSSKNLFLTTGMGYYSMIGNYYLIDINNGSTAKVSVVGYDALVKIIDIRNCNITIYY